MPIRSLLDAVCQRKRYANHPRPKQFDADIVVVGAGAAGLISACSAVKARAKVVLIEAEKMGGDCLYFGCVPSKAIIQSAKFIAHAKRAQDFGIAKAEITFSFQDIMQRVQEKITAIEPHDSIERYEKMGVECIQGKGKITSPWAVAVNGRTITTRNIIIATGAAPSLPEIAGLANVAFYTSDTIWQLPELPPRLLVLGGGPVGCELAQTFARLGSEVTIVERNTRLMKNEDAEVSAALHTRFASEGIRVLSEHHAEAFQQQNNAQSLQCQHRGETVHIAFDAVLLATGRQARVTGFGLEELGVALTASNAIAVNDYLQTSYPNIYAAGDVIGKYQFTHAAAYMAEICVFNALFFKKRIRYQVIPRAIFTEPEIARVGFNEQEAKAQGIACDVSFYALDDLDRAITDSETEGFVKVLTQKNSDKILGATVVGMHAGESIQEFILAMQHGLGLNKIRNTIHSYPTWNEANRFVAERFHSACQSEQRLRLLEKFHRWRRGTLPPAAG